jgi:uncharacterized protein (TIGR03032 family)
MGIALAGNKMAIGCKDEIMILENSTELAANYPRKPGVYDGMFVPRATFHTGIVDMHDLAFGSKGIWAVNTSFSCLCEVNGNYNFLPRWKPSFISDLEGEDRCHLNGLATENGKPRYVTALGQGNEPQSWRKEITEGGVLIDLKSDKILYEKLPMPHSPVIYKGALYGLLSATGEFVCFDMNSRAPSVISSLGGFCRGLDIVGDYAFIGMSKLRKGSSTFAKLDFAERADQSGIKIIHIPSGNLVGEIEFETTVDEIYEVKVLRNVRRPNFLNTIDPVYKYSLAIPGKTFWADASHEVFKQKEVKA